MQVLDQRHPVIEQARLAMQLACRADQMRQNRAVQVGRHGQRNRSHPRLGERQQPQSGDQAFGDLCANQLG